MVSPSGHDGAEMLAGVRVLDLTRYQAGPYGAMLLADMGAEVIKVESPGRGDWGRRMTPFRQVGFDPYFAGLNRNKKSITLDLKQERGKRLFYDLVKHADVVMDNFRPGVHEELGIDYATLTRRNPRIITCHISGFGHTGPYREHAAFDHVVQAMGGVMSLTGGKDDPPRLVGYAIGDAAAGMFAAQGVAAALFHRERTGEGRALDISMLDAQISILSFEANICWATGKPRPKRGSSELGMPASLPLKCADGLWLYLVGQQDNHWQGLCRAVKAVTGEDTFSTDKRFKDRFTRIMQTTALDETLREVFATAPSAAWLEALWAEGVPAGPVNTVDKVVEDPQVLARNMVVETPLSPAKDGTPRALKVVGNPIKSLGRDDDAIAPPPELGAHTDHVLSDVLGMSANEIERLRNDRII